MDLEHRRRSVSRCHPDCGPLPRQAALERSRKALSGPTAPQALQWAERRKEELDTGKFSALLTAIRRQVYRSTDARRCLHDFQTNRERMRYPEFHAQGLCTSTGVVEAARSPLAHGPNVPECTGPFAALTPSLLSAAQNSVVVFKTSGSADQNAGPHDPSLSWSAAVPIDLLDACPAPALFPNSRLRDHNGEDFTSRPATSPQNAVHCSFFPDSNFGAHRNIGAAHELRQNRSPLSLCRIFQATKMSMNTESGNHDE